MAADGTTPRVSASSPPTVGTLLTRASAARDRGCSSPRSLLSRILHGGRGRSGAGFGCRIRLLPRYCASASAAAAKEDAIAAAKHEEEDEPAEVEAAQPAPREPGGPRSSLGKQDALPASLGLGASLVLLLSKSAAELSRMAELRAQMERLLVDARADARSCTGRPSASGGRSDCASAVKGPVARAGGEDEDDGACPGPMVTGAVTWTGWKLSLRRSCRACSCREPRTSRTVRLADGVMINSWCRRDRRAVPPQGDTRRSAPKTTATTERQTTAATKAKTTRRSMSMTLMRGT
uniref:Uncharacterized protein n=1 Tax=Zea mays TaxID=4577 RepID=B8A3N0_MAIZE|nr:unknown [Zea mays]|eukprot:NP_001146800.1 uncharacterized LOC100280405 [Zea mays]